MNEEQMKAIQAIDDYFKSGNSVPVSRATIKREEWELAKAALDRHLERLRHEGAEMNTKESPRSPLEGLVGRLRELAKEMESVSVEMQEYASQAWDGETADHANELLGAAEIARTWAGGLAVIGIQPPNNLLTTGRAAKAAAERDNQ